MQLGSDDTDDSEVEKVYAEEYRKLERTFTSEDLIVYLAEKNKLKNKRKEEARKSFERKRRRASLLEKRVSLVQSSIGFSEKSADMTERQQLQKVMHSKREFKTSDRDPNNSVEATSDQKVMDVGRADGCKHMVEKDQLEKKRNEIEFGLEKDQLEKKHNEIEFGGDQAIIMNRVM